MTDFAARLLPDHGQPARLLHSVSGAGLAAWREGRSGAERAMLDAAGFAGKPGEVAILPGEGDAAWSVALGRDETAGPWDLAAAAARLPEGVYRLAGDAPPGAAALGWLLAQHRFDRYRAAPVPAPRRVLLTADAAGIDAIVRLAVAIALVRDLVDTPAADMGPAELATAAGLVAERDGAAFAVTQGDALRRGFPMIHAVGRAAAAGREPRLIELAWGDPAHPRIAIVGKGVCFDSGGLDLKPSAGMLLMKKDMGGAAHALALAGLVMQARLPVRLHLLIPAVENAVSADAFRPGDVLASRLGPSVEIGNTDAEGRLVLADALAYAAEGEGGVLPELILDFATLTGAARTALGPDLPALFANDEPLAADLIAAGADAADPLWRLPLWAGYAEMLASGIADINNAGEGGMAGAITAALFLQRFVPDGIAWAHLDTYAWRPAARPGRPKGGAALGLVAMWEMLRRRYGGA